MGIKKKFDTLYECNSYFSVFESPCFPCERSYNISEIVPEDRVVSFQCEGLAENNCLVCILFALFEIFSNANKKENFIVF